LNLLQVMLAKGQTENLPASLDFRAFTVSALRELDPGPSNFEP
jgi:hypothetical protein